MEAALAQWGGASDTIYALIGLWALGSARMLGATLVFTAFVWGHLNSGIIRAVLAGAVAFPVLAPLASSPTTAMAEIDPIYWILLPKELGIGLLIGFVAALPLEAVGVAGNVVDGVRGGGQLPGPSGDNTLYGQLFMVVALWVFAASGGFFHFVDMIYSSYALWPLTRTLPPVNPDILPALWVFLARFLTTAATLAGPAVILLLAVDAVLLVMNRLGKRMNVLDLSLTIKNLMLLALVPVYIFVLVRLVGENLQATYDLRPLAALFRW